MEILLDDIETTDEIKLGDMFKYEGDYFTFHSTPAGYLLISLCGGRILFQYDKYYDVVDRIVELIISGEMKHFSQLKYSLRLVRKEK